jgi:MoaA/NifB/PqqE/SkfB family radical SAM enzyme
VNWPDLTKDRVVDQEPEFDHAKCYAGRYFCSIGANGDVSPCTPLGEVKFRNCLEVGFRQAFDDISKHNCKACCWACYNEYNLIFGLDVGVILNMARNFFRNSPILQSSQMFLGREGIRHF